MIITRLPVRAPLREPFGNAAIFSDLICAELKERRAESVLDIGAGSSLISWLQPIRKSASELVGIDPDPRVLDHPDLDRALCGCVEDVDAGDLKSDLAYAFNVVEHVARPSAFLRRVHDLLRPGGSFWMFSTNEWHPFCVLGHVIRLGRVKNCYRSVMRLVGHNEINEYPSYYRLNRVARIARLAQQSGFRQLQYVQLMSGWEAYFPPPLRFVPRAYDAVVQRWLPAGRLILVCRLVR